MNVDAQGLRHLQALRSFIGNLVDQAERSGVCDCHKPPSLLLVGPPGAGKTYLVKQMSNVCEMPLYGVHTNQVRGAPAVRKLFEQARDNYPSLVFMDDVDAIFSNHDDDPSCTGSVQSIRDELFTQLGPRKLKIADPKSSKNPTNSTLGSGDGDQEGRKKVGGFLESATLSRLQPSAPPEEDEDIFDDEDSTYPDNNGIIVVAATSTPWLLYKDHELLSRFRGVYLVGLPDKQTRYNLLKSLFQDVHHNLTDKDIMVVAEKTEGFTPADLMVVVKTLTYRQFSFLLSMASAHTASVGSSSDVGSTGSQTPLSSELSETASESDLDGLPESEGHLKKGVVTAAVAVAAAAAAAASPSNAASGAVPKKEMKQSSNGKIKVPVTAAPAAISMTALGNDWDSDSDEVEVEEPPESQRDEQKVKPENTRVPTRVLEDSLVCKSSEGDNSEERGRDDIGVPSPDSAIGLSKSSEEIVDPKNSTSLDKLHAPLRTPSESSSSGVTSSNCDSSDSSAIVEDGVQEAVRHPPLSSDSEIDVETVSTGSDRGEERTTGEDSLKVKSEGDADMDSTVIEEVKEEPNCESVLDEVDSDEDLDDIERGDGDVERVGTPVEFELHYSEPPDPMRDDNCAIDSDSDNDVSEAPRSRGGRRVAFSGMSSMEPLSVDVGDNCGPPNVSLDNLQPNITLTPSNLPEPMLTDDHHTEAQSNAMLLRLLARPSPSRSQCRDQRLDDPSELSSFLHPVPDLDLNKTSTPIEPMGPLTPTPMLSPTPTPSEGSSHNGTVGSSGSGTHASAGSSSSEVHKKEDSDSSVDHSDGHTVPSSDISTATCNETGETMECRTDSDERLQEFEDVPDHQDSAHASDYDTPTETKAVVGGLNSLLNLDDLGEISIQLITLADVLQVVAKGYRSVSDEEIKRYTDFMVWFSNVAKSACPHSKDGSQKANAPHLDDISLDSTVYDTPSIAKKRKGPLRKLGRFLLKALMFILD